MSISIDMDKVTMVLLADGWHKIQQGSFLVDAHEYVLDGEIYHGGGDSGASATGFTFDPLTGGRIYGPLTAILAVRTEEAT